MAVHLRRKLVSESQLNTSNCELTAAVGVSRPPLRRYFELARGGGLDWGERVVVGIPEYARVGEEYLPLDEKS